MKRKWKIRDDATLEALDILVGRMYHSLLGTQLDSEPIRTIGDPILSREDAWEGVHVLAGAIAYLAVWNTECGQRQVEGGLVNGRIFERWIERFRR